MPCVVPRVSLKCEHCFETFLRMQCELTRGRGRFCSKRCLYNSRIVRVSLTCMACGVSFERKASEADRHEGAYCSRSCYESHRKENAHCYPKIAGVHAHRVVAEQKLGRKLHPGEIVHHKDENKLNYSLDNLEVLKNQAEHLRLHHPDVIVRARLARKSRRKV